MAKATFKLQKFHVRINVTALPWVSGQRLGSTSSLRLHLRYDASTNTIDSTRGRGCWPLETWPFCRYLPPQPRLWGPGRGRVTTPATTRCTNVAVLGASLLCLFVGAFHPPHSTLARWAPPSTSCAYVSLVQAYFHPANYIDQIPTPSQATTAILPSLVAHQNAFNSYLRDPFPSGCCYHPSAWFARSLPNLEKFDARLLRKLLPGGCLASTKGTSVLRRCQLLGEKVLSGEGWTIFWHALRLHFQIEHQKYAMIFGGCRSAPVNVIGIRWPWIKQLLEVERVSVKSSRSWKHWTTMNNFSFGCLGLSHVCNQCITSTTNLNELVKTQPNKPKSIKLIT